MKYLIYTLSLLVVAFLYSCGNDTHESSDKPVETSTTGSIMIGVDQTVKPVLQQQLKVWDSLYPNGNIAPKYGNEAYLFNSLFQDSVDLIIATRDITQKERDVEIKKSRKYSSQALARDAAVFIVNEASQDDRMTLAMLSNILQGKFPRSYNVIFDHGSSSLVRYVQDSVMGGAPFTEKVFAAGSNEEVIEYVKKNKDALGIIGMTHAFDQEVGDAAGAFKSGFKVVALKNDTFNKFYKPYQAFLATMEYPLTRKIYFIVRDRKRGLATGFANFLKQPEGQLIFKKSWLVPLRVELQIRSAKLN